jgi:uncharacterized membrane protein
VIQTLALALGAWPIYLLARLKLPAGYPLIWVAAYFLFVPLAFINLYDFHEIALAVAPLGFALYFLENNRPRWFLVSLLITLLVKEEMGLIAAGFGAYALLGKRDWKLGLGVLAGSMVAFAAIILVAIPYFGHGRSFVYFQQRYSQVGGTPGGMLATIFTDPMRIVLSLLKPKKAFFVIGIFGPVLGLSWLAGWASLLVLPTLGYLLLSNYEPQYSFTAQDCAPLIPLVLGTSILALARLREPALRPVMVGVLVSSLIFSWAYGDMPWSRKFDTSLFRAQARYAEFVPSLALIAPDARVSAENGFPSHLSGRRFIYDYTYEGLQDAEWVVLDYAGVNFDMPTFQAQVVAAGAAGYELVASGTGLVLMHKR